MPSTSRHPEHHSYGEQHTPNRRLQEDVYPQDRVDWCVHLLLRQLIVMFVRGDRENACEEDHRESPEGHGHS